MLKKITLLATLAVMVFGVAVLAGCGGDDEKAGSAPKTESTDSGGSGNTDVKTDTKTSDDPNIQAAVDSCKQAIDAQPSLKADTKADLQKVCEKAGSGDIKDAQAAAKEVCEKIVEDTVPSGSAQDQAKAACAQAAP